MKEYQQKKAKEFVLPEAVYRQALWAAKDLLRLKSRLEELQEEIANQGGGSIVKEGKIIGKHTDMAAEKAVEAANLSMRINAIEDALISIPEKYREGIRRNVFYGLPYGDDYHDNTWKKWKQVYIYYVAQNLGLG